LTNDHYVLLEGDCREVLKGYDDSTFDSIVTDPPYGLKFMNKSWDHDVPGLDYWQAIFRVAKPGAFCLAFGGARKFHRLACAIEDAGWLLSDCIGWIYGGGMPKARGRLKPAWNPIIVACKGVAPLNVEDCRVPPTGESRERVGEPSQDRRYTESGGTNFAAKPGVRGGSPKGRHPANIIHDGSDEVLAIFPEEAGQAAPLARRSSDKFQNTYGAFKGQEDAAFEPHDDLGSASRFFYCVRASTAERGEGNDGPCVKPLALMRYLVRLITPPGGIVLDPFMGSGSGGLAALQEDRLFVGIDDDPHAVEIATRRLMEAKICKRWSGD
jgi:site-specific DNA-methyltransferase (adenine-specific)